MTDAERKLLELALCRNASGKELEAARVAVLTERCSAEAKAEYMRRATVYFRARNALSELGLPHEVTSDWWYEAERAVGRSGPSADGED